MTDKADTDPNGRRMRKRPAWLRALGNADPPATVRVSGRDYGLLTVFKHDSWAATALYADSLGERITCKFNRMQPVFVIPMQWLGRILARREARFLRLLAPVPLVPDDMGPVVADGDVLRNAVARRFVDGEPFRSGTTVDAAFFEQLRGVLDALHAHDMAYVDLHKRENIIIDTEGRPHLIDFQVSYGLGERWPWNGSVSRLILRRLQEMDDYHYRKHYARCLKHVLDADEYRRLLEPPGLIRWHRKFGVPLRALRRRLLTTLGLRDRSGQAGSELEPEDAFRETRGADPDRR
jgi:hypothetical protein